MPSINFFVDAPLLVKRAGKPFHLEKRLQSRKCVSHEDNVARREAFLHARRTKLTMYQEQLKIAVEEHRKKNEDRLTATRNKIENDLQTAEELRAQKLMAFKQSQSEVVAKAKSTARMNKQKQLQGAAELQDDIAAKLRVSALRRKKLAEIPRSKLLNATSWGYQEEAQVLDDAAVTIQSWYRKCKLRPITRLYKKMGMTRENLLAIGFPKMMAKLQIEPLIKTVKILLLRAKKTTGKSVSHLKNPARTFLSLYMVVLYSDETLQSSEAQEVDLKNIATASLELFETWMSSARASVARKFMDTFISYYNAFEAWKTRDTFKVVDDLVGQFMELEGLWLSVMNQVDADGEWAPAIQEQQNEISKRLASFGPSALSRLEAQRTITRDQVIQSNAPVDIFSQAMTSNEMYRVKVNNVPIEVKQDVDSSVEPEAELDSAEFGAFLSNEMLAHELVMDPNYSLKPAAKSPLETQVSEIAKKAFTDALREDINNGNYANYVFGMVVQIREALLSMLTTEGAIATKIKESLEPEYLKHQIENKSFDLAAAMNYVGHQMLELCAPMRDRSIRALKDEKDMAIVMMSIMEILEGMKLDLANYRLQSIRPQLVRQAVQFEKAKFDKAVQDNRVSLNKTTAWLNESVIELQRIADERNPDNIETPEVKTNFDDVLNHAYLQTFFGTKAPNSADIAETMVMDSERIFNLQNEFQALAIVASLGIVSKNMFASIRKDELAIKELKEKLFDILKLGSTNVDAIATLIISVCNGARERKAMLMTNLSKQTSNPTAHDFTAVTDEESQAVRNLVERTISYKDPLFALIFRRIQSVVRTHLSRNVFKAETLPRQGLDMIAAELQILSEKVVSFCSHNKQVHHTHFNAILESLIK